MSLNHGTNFIRQTSQNITNILNRNKYINYNINRILNVYFIYMMKYSYLISLYNFNDYKNNINKFRQYNAELLDFFDVNNNKNYLLNSIKDKLEKTENIINNKIDKNDPVYEGTNGVFDIIIILMNVYNFFNYSIYIIEYLNNHTDDESFRYYPGYKNRDERIDLINYIADLYTEFFEQFPTFDNNENIENNIINSINYMINNLLINLPNNDVLRQIEDIKEITIEFEAVLNNIYIDLLNWIGPIYIDLETNFGYNH